MPTKTLLLQSMHDYGGMEGQLSMPNLGCEVRVIRSGPGVRGLESS